MRIIVSNDDGYRALGLTTLVERLSNAGHEVFVFAPNTQQSGQSMAITLRRPVKIEKINSRIYAVFGTPVDSINLAQTSGLIDDCDLVISGINHGQNLGDDTLYSGTVAAAMEARHFSLPSIACSSVSFEPKHMECSANWVVKLVEKIDLFGVNKVDVLNVNIPDLPFDEIAGFELTQLSRRKLSEPPTFKSLNDDQGEYMIGGVGDFLFDDKLSAKSRLRYDFEVIADNRISITPLKAQLVQVEMTELCKELNS